VTGPHDAPAVDFEVDTYRLVLLSPGEEAATLDQASVEELEREHLRFLLGLETAGQVLAAGAVVGATATASGGRPLVGLGFFQLPA
jgi:hypothetical protein